MTKKSVVRPFNVGGSPLTRKQILVLENDLSSLVGGSKQFMKPGCRVFNGEFTSELQEDISAEHYDFVAVSYEKLDDGVRGEFILAGYQLDTVKVPFSMDNNEFGMFCDKVFTRNIDKARKYILALGGK